MSGLLTGCATTQWYNPNYSADDAAQMTSQKAIDEGYCTQVAHGAAPMPDIRIYESGQQAYNISGTITTYGQGGLYTSNYSGHVTPSPATSFSSGFSSGLAQGAALGATIRARRAQDAIMKGCMLKLGWTDKPPTQGTNLAPPASRVTEKNPSDISTHDQQHVELSCSSHRKIAELIDELMRDNVTKEKALEFVLKASKKHNLNYKSTAYTLWAANARYSIPEASTEDFLDFITDYCSKGWPDVKL
ncbi:hypothetical protein ACWKWV_06610 [Castellaniella ginsengisoli]